VVEAAVRMLIRAMSASTQRQTYVAVTSAAAAAAQGGVRSGGISAKCLKMFRTSRG